MRPISRETIIDRKQPLLRWGAVIAGAAISIALWVLLQLLGMGVGLAAIHVDDAGSLRDLGIGTTAWTCVAPMIAMFIGGIIAGRMAGTHDRGVGSVHGFVVWALTSLLGIAALVALITTLVNGVLPDVSVAAPNGQPSSAELQHATTATGQILLGAGVSMLVSLATAVLGGCAGVTKRERRRESDRPDRTIVTPVVPPPATTTVVEATPPAP